MAASTNPTAQRLQKQLVDELTAILLLPVTDNEKRRRAQEVITRIYSIAFIEGGGVLPSKDLDVVIGYAERGFRNTLKKVNKKTWTVDQARTRFDTIWTFGLAQAFHTGLYNDPTQQDVQYVWRIGATLESCSSCLWANGQVKTIREWKATGLMPQSSALECTGRYCDCGLYPVT